MRRRRGEQCCKARWRVGALVLFVGAAVVCQEVSKFSRSEGRRLSGTKSICKSVYRRIDGDGARARGKDFTKSQIEKVKSGASCTSAHDNVGLFIASIFFALYLFIGIAIVCDELFVSALEVISERWDLSDDVSGATLMAAGGSAPELATSFIGTFQGSTVGLGTIVGSAVFNVLFVIGMCALKTPEKYAPLKLTWWPLARDCSYYVLTLAALLVWFIAPNSRGAIEGWEAICQLLLYCGYVFVMKHNTNVEKFVKNFLAARRKRASAIEPVNVEMEEAQKDDEEEPSKSRRNSLEQKDANFSRPSTFRTSIVNILLKKNKSMDGIAGTAGVCVVSKVKGDVLETFSKLDVDHNGSLDFGEIRQLLQNLGDPDDHTDAKVEELKTLLDTNNNNTIDINEFTTWYVSSESRLKAETKLVFDEFDLDKSGTIDVSEVRQVVAMLAEGKPHFGEKEVALAVDDFHKSVAHNGRDACDYAEFQTWYETTVFWKHAQRDADEAADSINGMWATVMASLVFIPKASFGEACLISALLPLNFLLALTIPDCRVPGKEKLCYFTFMGSIFWIGLYSYFMVKAIEIIGCYINVPPFIMGKL